MALFHRCIDQFGYCLSPETPEIVATPETAFNPSIHVIANCKYDPQTCKHYRTLTQSLELNNQHDSTVRS